MDKVLITPVLSLQLTPEYFENEYNRLPKGQLHAWEAAKKAEHRTKNRWVTSPLARGRFPLLHLTNIWIDSYKVSYF